MKAHRTDLLSLAFGLLFLAAAAWWLLSQLLDLMVPIGWFLAGALVVVGALGLLGALRATRSSAPAAGPAAGVPKAGSTADAVGTSDTSGTSDTGSTSGTSGSDTDRDQPADGLGDRRG
ncbi:hypothetical protein GA0074692_6073 [Micromonospora pallida]|uniref:Uncharacterized protein n=1 Tax=Micromonospora pallida TaxID=145854 RepID=A0A1C6TH38_9ACTN|nr:hypothetical protein [Micromonospora pallida]SCL40967.1 hypothetical protein GA0074692_6073 [Micromonospora pallida]